MTSKIDQRRETSVKRRTKNKQDLAFMQPDKYASHIRSLSKLVKVRKITSSA